jgi:ribose transport system substrate-binding protein
MQIKSSRFAVPVVVAVLGLILMAGFGDDDESAGAETAAADSVEVKFSDSPEIGLPTEYPPVERGDYTVGLLNPSRSTEFLTLVFDAAKAKVEELGGTPIELDAALSPDAQVSQFEQLINRKVDAIAMVPIAGPNVLGPLLQKAAQAKIPVIGYDVTPGVPRPAPGFASQIWQQRDKQVYLQVRAAAETLPRGSEIAQIGLALPVPLFEFTYERQRHWAREFGLKIVDKADSKSDTTAGAEAPAAGLIARHADLAGILGYNDEPAIAAALAARAAGRRDFKTFGMTGASLARGALANDRLTASVYVDPIDLGEKAAEGAYAAAEGKKLPPVVLAGKPYIVTKENADDTKNTEAGE